jgi:adenosyl cobinamide kinase/adenosyl cobinamide phosphate guanylyltransferase
MYLPDQEMHDRVYSTHKERRAPDFVFFKVRNDNIKFMEHQLEPELIGLVDDYEKGLVMMRRI